MVFHADHYGLPKNSVSEGVDMRTAQGIVRAVVARRFVSYKLGRKTPKEVE